MTNQNNKELTSKEIIIEIRLLCGMEIKQVPWFSRKEIKTIAKKSNPSARFISDDPNNASYLPSRKIFPKYIPNWTTQETANSHPVKENLLAIYKSLRENNPVKTEAKAVVQKTSEVVINNKRLKAILDSESLLSKIEKMLVHPDNTIEINFRR